jgi:eukaryotic-like serine/threonine-protein kinase
VETALLRQVPQSTTRHAATDATSLVPAVAARPGWARLPEQQGAQPGAYGRPTGGTVTRAGARAGAGPDRRRILLIAAVVVMVLVVLGSTWWVTLGRYTESPALVNMTKTQAELYVGQHHFELFYGDPVFSDTVPKDSVVSQDPPATEKIVKGGTITVNLSRGPQSFAVPDLVGAELSAAKADLAQATLVFKQGASIYSDTVTEGAVISTDPKAGTPLKRGDTVTVVVSKGRAPISVPNLTGQNINQVRATLQGLGLTALERYKDSDQPADTVIGQSPPAGTGVAKDDKVTLDVSKGPPLVTIPDLTNQPCQQAQGTLQGLGLQVQLQVNPNAFVRLMNPGPNTPVPPQTVVTLQCF